MFDVTDYGRQFAEVYDSLIPEWSFTPAAARAILEHSRVDTPDILELGVGTGRVLLRIREALREAGAEEAPVLWGVDSSPEMLEGLSRRDEASAVVAHLGDIRTFRSEERFDLVLCVCNTIGMSVDEGYEEAVFATAFHHLRSGGAFVVEVHNPKVRELLFGENGPGAMFAQYPGIHRGLVSFGRLEGSVMTVDQVWLDDGTATFRTESVRLATTEELTRWGSAAGFDLEHEFADLEGAEPQDLSIGNVLVFRKA